MRVTGLEHGALRDALERSPMKPPTPPEFELRLMVGVSLAATSDDGDVNAAVKLRVELSEFAEGSGPNFVVEGISTKESVHDVRAVANETVARLGSAYRGELSNTAEDSLRLARAILRWL